MGKELKSEFDWLVAHHDEIKNFKIENAHVILENYSSRYCKYPKIIPSHIEADICADIEKLKSLIMEIRPEEKAIQDAMWDINIWRLSVPAPNGFLRTDFLELFETAIRDKLNQIIDDIPLYNKKLFWDNNEQKVAKETKELVAKARNSPNDFDSRIMNRLILEDICKNIIKRRRKFKLTNEEDEKDPRLSLSSTTICTYALSQYYGMWDEEKITAFSQDVLKDFYAYIIDGLAIFLGKPQIKGMVEEGKNLPHARSDEHTRGFSKSSRENQISKLESIDEFSLLNILSFLKKIQNVITINDSNSEVEWSYREDVPKNIIAKLCNEYFNNGFAYQDNTHPFIYYTFLCILNDWKKEILTLSWDEAVGEKNSKSFIYWIDPKNHDSVKKQIYYKGKYEMYRQLALYNANDRSLFDIKRLIYSLLIVTMDNVYSNDKILKNIVDIIFNEQLETGLWLIGSVVNNNFVLEDGEIITKSSRIINISPILSSIECLNDMLDHETIYCYLINNYKNYNKNLSKAYDWIKVRLRDERELPVLHESKFVALEKALGELAKSNDIDEITMSRSSDLLDDRILYNREILDVVSKKDKGSKKPTGWYPEYEGTHVPKSWVAGHTLVLLKKYCEFLSLMIERSASEYLEAVNPEDLKITCKKLLDTYNIKKCLNMMINGKDGNGQEIEIKSAFLFGPPGTGKSTVAKALAKDMGWKYVEITPGQFLDEGETRIISTASFIFNRLLRMKKVVVFFDEVDQFVELRKNSSESSKWIVTSLLPKFQKLHNKKEIKFFLATNNIDSVDSAMRRSGRIDLILPMGPTNWKDRLKYLKEQYEKRALPSDGSLQGFYSNFRELEKLDDLTRDKIAPKSCTARFLIMTDYMLFADLTDFVREIINYTEQKNDLKNLFLSNEEEFELYMDNELEEFHNSKIIGDNKKYIRYPLVIRKEIERSGGINSIICENNFLSFILSEDQLLERAPNRLGKLMKMIEDMEKIEKDKKIKKLENMEQAGKIKKMEKIEQDYTTIKKILNIKYNLNELNDESKLLEILNYLILYPTYLIDEDRLRDDPNINKILAKIKKDTEIIGQANYKRKRYDALVINRLILQKLFPDLVKRRMKCDISCKYKVKIS